MSSFLSVAHGFFFLLGRNHLEASAEQEFQAARTHRKGVADLDARRKQADKLRREREAAFRKQCVADGVLPTAQAPITDAVKAAHDHVADFVEELEIEKAAEDEEFGHQRQALEDDFARQLSAVRTTKKSDTKPRERL